MKLWYEPDLDPDERAATITSDEVDRARIAEAIAIAVAEAEVAKDEVISRITELESLARTRYEACKDNEKIYGKLIDGYKAEITELKAHLSFVTSITESRNREIVVLKQRICPLHLRCCDLGYEKK